MKITDGIKLGIGVIICKAGTDLIVEAGEKLKNYILENDFDDECMNAIKGYLKKKTCKPKKKVKKEDYTKIEIRGFRAD